MYARTTTVQGDPGAVDEGVEYVRDAVRPMLLHMSGCVGMSMLADRRAGRCIVTAAWATEEAMRASAEIVRDSRSRVAETLRAERVDIREWEIAALHRVHPAGDGAGARVIWSEGAPDQLDRTIDAFRMALLPRMEQLPGFCSVSLLVDRATGDATTTITYAHRDALLRSREQAAALREEFAGRVGARIAEVAEFELAVAHLRVPEMA